MGVCVCGGWGVGGWGVGGSGGGGRGDGVCRAVGYNRGRAGGWVGVQGTRTNTSTYAHLLLGPIAGNVARFHIGRVRIQLGRYLLHYTYYTIPITVGMQACLQAQYLSVRRYWTGVHTGAAAQRTCWPTPTPRRMAWLVSMPRTYDDRAWAVSHAWKPAEEAGRRRTAAREEEREWE